MKLQIALDDITLEDALVLVGKVRDYIDIIEIGTPFVYEYGMQAVRTMKKTFSGQRSSCRYEDHGCRILRS